MIVNNEKMCGNCEFWEGSRKVSFQKTKAETVGGSMGKCICPKCPESGTKKDAGAIKNCRKFVKWSKLK